MSLAGLHLVEAAAHAPHCSTQGCHNLAFDGRYCMRCAEEMEGLGAGERRRAQKAEQKQAAGAQSAPRWNLSDWAYFGATVATIWLLVWETRTWWIELFQMWLFGGR